MKVGTMVLNAQLGLHGSCPFDLLPGQYYNSGLISVYCYKSDVKDVVPRPSGNTNAAHDFITSYFEWRMNHGAHCVDDANTSSRVGTGL